MDQETWKILHSTLDGFEGDVYEVSSLGRVRRGHHSFRHMSARRDLKRLTFLYLKPRLNKGTWEVAYPSKKYTSVAQLVLKAFVGEKPKHSEITFLNGNAQDCRLENLTYQPLKITSTTKQKRLTEDEAEIIRNRVASIRRNIVQGKGRARVNRKILEQIAAEFGVSVSTVYRVT